MNEFCALRAKTYSFKLDDDTENKRAKGKKKCIVKREITFKNNADAFFKDKVLIKSQQRFRSDHHKVYTEEVNKIALSSNDDKRIQTFDRVTTHPYGTNAFMVCKNEMLLKNKFIDNTDGVVCDWVKNTRNSKPSLRSKSYVSRDTLEMDDYSSMLKKHSKILRSNVEIYKDNISLLRNKLNGINIKLSMPISIFEEIIKKDRMATDLVNEFDKTDNDKEDTVIDASKPNTDDNEDTVIDCSKPNTDDISNADVLLEKTNLLIDNVNLLTKIRNDFSNNVSEVYMLMSELQDDIYTGDSWLRLLELQKINVSLNDSLDCVWCIVHDKKREKYDMINIDKDKDINGYVSKYTDIVNDKLDLVNEIGELLYSIMVQIHNAVNMVKETDDDKLTYDILDKNWMKWYSDINKMVSKADMCSKPCGNMKYVQESKKKKKKKVKNDYV